MIQLEATICSVDGKTIDRSFAYKAIRRLFGKKVADKLTYEVTGPKVDDD